MEGKHQGPLPKFFIMEPSSFKVKSATGSTLTSIYYTSCIYKVPEKTWRKHVNLYLDVHLPIGADSCSGVCSALTDGGGWFIHSLYTSLVIINTQSPGARTRKNCRPMETSSQSSLLHWGFPLKLFRTVSGGKDIWIRLWVQLFPMLKMFVTRLNNF